MKIWNTEINLFRREGLIFEFIVMKSPAPMQFYFVIWLGVLGLELTIDIGSDVRRKELGVKVA